MNIDLNVLDVLGPMMAENDLSEVFLVDDSIRLRLLRTNGARLAVSAVARAPDALTDRPAAGTVCHLISPAVGTLMFRQRAGKKRHCAQYQKGEVVAFVIVGLLRLPVTAPADGALGDLLVQTGSLVDVGTPLFDFIPA